MKKLILLTLLLIGNYSYSQKLVNCVKKFNMKAKPEVNECTATEASTGISQGYLDCVCENRKRNKKKSSSKTNGKTEKKKKTENEKAAELHFQLTQQYNSMVAEAKSLQSQGKKNTPAYADLLKRIRGHESALKIPRHKYFDNPGFVNENTGNATLDNTYKKINDVKENSEQFGNQMSSTLGNVFQNLAGAGDRRRERKYKEIQIKKAERKKREAEVEARYNQKKEEFFRRYSNMSDNSKKQEAFLFNTILENPKNELFEEYLKKFTLNKDKILFLKDLFNNKNNLELDIISNKLINNKKTIIHNFKYYGSDSNRLNKNYIYLTINAFSIYQKFLTRTTKLSIDDNLLLYLSSQNLTNLKSIRIEGKNNPMKHIETLYNFKNIEKIQIFTYYSKNVETINLNKFGGIESLKRIYISDVNIDLNKDENSIFELKNLSELIITGSFYDRNTYDLLKKRHKYIKKEFKEKKEKVKFKVKTRKSF